MLRTCCCQHRQLPGYTTGKSVSEDGRYQALACRHGADEFIAALLTDSGHISSEMVMNIRWGTCCTAKELRVDFDTNTEQHAWLDMTYR